jgi:transglutaminase-like putative cysteine protease
MNTFASAEPGHTDGSGRVRLHLTLELAYEVCSPVADFVFNFQLAHTRQQQVLGESLFIQPALTQTSHTDPHTLSRFLRLSAPQGALRLRYQADVVLAFYQAAPASVQESPVASLPPEALAYLYPSRYCESDRLIDFAIGLFGHLPKGYGRVQAIQQWVRDQVAFKSATSNSMTSALNTLQDRVGVCRDFAHLMVALCRALSIPARFTTGMDFGADPALGPPDFHAYVEVYLSGRWYIFDPSGTAIPLGFVRIGTGRDAADVSFATIFGAVQSQPPVIAMRAETGHGWLEPRRVTSALSSDDGRGA